MNSEIENTILRERLVAVEQQLQFQKEALTEMNDTLREVVKTQHILANQRRDIDQLSSDVRALVSKAHQDDIDNASYTQQTETSAKRIDVLEKQMKEDVIPKTETFSTYFRLIGLTVTAAWMAILAILQGKYQIF